MKFADYLSAADIQKFNQLRKATRNRKEYKTARKTKNSEHLSQKDLKELMGVYKDVYIRQNGAIRRR